MRNWTKFASLCTILVAVEVLCNVTGREPIRDLHDALVLIPGSKVNISCCGDVFVDREIAVQGACAWVHESDSQHITTKKIGRLASSNHRPDPVDSLETNQLQGEAFTLHEGTAWTDDESGSYWSDEPASYWSEMDRWSQWTFNDQPVQNVTKMDGNLIIPRFGLTDGGNYSCYRAGRRMSTVTIHPANSTERPTFTCRRKAPERKIRCDWKARQPVSPEPKCHFIFKKSDSLEQQHRVPCRYSATRSRCRCLFELQYSDSCSYTAVLFVRSPLGSGTSERLEFTPASVLKPDPPNRVHVTPVEGEEQMLQVSWSYPMSWKKKGFYYLKFELKYHPEHGKMYQTELVKKSPWMIRDALPNVQYTVQIRAKEEHDQGNWSDWSPPVYTNTWTAPMPTEAPNATDISEEPVIFIDMPDKPSIPSTGADAVGNPGGVSGLMWVHMVSVIGCCVVGIMFVLVFIKVIRHRIHFKSKVEKLCFPFPSPAPPLRLAPCQRKAPDCPQSNSPSQEPPCDLSPEHDATKQHVHFHNMSYFLTKTDTS